MVALTITSTTKWQMFKDSNSGYGAMTKSLHWVSALTIIGLFASGWWMVELNYYSQWYKTAPHWHKSIGLLLLFTSLARVLWRYITPSVLPVDSHSKTARVGAKITHTLLYLLLFIAMFSGYLISTADGQAIEVFNWFEIPSLGEFIEQQEDIAGEIHEIATYSLIALTLLHAGAAVKHQLIDKDKTLSRML